jgi:YVTN family beta-propeller protein
MRFGVLGPLEVRSDDGPLMIRGVKERRLVGLLLSRANSVVPVDDIIEALWGAGPPPSAARSVQVYVVRVRKILEPHGPATNGSVLARRGMGYTLRADGGQVDALRFADLVDRAREAAAAGAYDSVVPVLREALSLWRGAAYADFQDTMFGVTEAARLEEMRLAAVEARIDADLALGRPAEVTSELEALVHEYPLRERFWSQLMLALYRGGRQADALAAYRRARELLAGELGLEPGEELRSLEQAVLRQQVPTVPPTAAHRGAAAGAVPAAATRALPRDHTSFTGRQAELAHLAGAPAHTAADGPAAAAAAASGPVRGTWRRRLVGADRKKWLLAVGGAVVLAAALLVAVTGHGGAHLVAAANTVGVIDTGQADLSGVVTGVGRPNGIAVGAGAVWVTDSADDKLLRVDAAGQVIDPIPVGRGPAGVAVGGGEVWVANQLDSTVSEVNPGAGRQVKVIPVGIGPSAVAFGFGSVWVANVTSDTLSRISAATGKVTATIPLGSAPAGVAVGFGFVWVAAQDTGELLRVDPAGDRVVEPISAGQSPDGVAAGGGAVWVADAGGAVTRYDPRTGNSRPINVGGTPAGVAYAGGAVWVANSLTGAVDKIDPRSGAVQPIRVGNEPTGLAAAGNRVWATVLPSLASHRGGTLTVIAQPQGSTDPAVTDSPLPWQMLSVTNDGLVGYRRVAGLVGDQLVPDLATTLPVPTGGGKTYVFQLRSGVRYSTGQLVRPEDFRRGIERVFMIDNKPGGFSFIPPYAFGGIVGAAQCERSPGRCDLSQGIVTSDTANTVTFHLTAPDPQFLYKLAFPWAYPVPSGTPDHQISAAQLPATGPYLTKSLIPAHAWVLVRNPRFRPWSQQAQPGGYPDRIVVRFDVAPGQAAAAVEHGRADVLLAPPPNLLGQLDTRYTSQLHSGPLVGTFALVLNPRIPPFNKLAARQALNYAIDRHRVIALNGGPLTAQPTCQILPPTMPGYQPYCPYTLHPSRGGAWTAPDLARAQRLVRASGTRGDTVTVLDLLRSNKPGAATARYVASVLDRLGYRASVRLTANAGKYGNLQSDSRNRPQISFYTWFQDFPAPWDFIGPLLTCTGNANAAGFCDPRIDAQVRQALALQTQGLAAAMRLWTTLDHELTDQAPWVPLYTPRALTVLSARVGNYQFHPFWNLLIDQLWVR